ncbi:Peroxisome biogenesis factor 10 [Seminavis robusta]|uniref:RING-type E3 ubiquitin transferase n=1 Tax=Seminavis robusta TaxID=568900 RepID=A0A9N8DRR8_9STRA|nr:Peroxisome biogenesis factor 10 [Seminavis robusta]|eukprot:Sro294_g110140.1 Peroxisome biogenesis factor 10 (457) ;mRNA; r:8846-10216
MASPPPLQNNHLFNGRLEFVPDGLLALAKDARYVKECQALFQQVISSVLPRRRHALAEQESWILASLLCLALGLRQTSKGTTLGMETVGLRFSNGASRWKLVASTLVALSWAYAFSAHNRTSSHDNDAISSGTTTRTTNNGATNPSAMLSADTQQNDELLRGVSRREFHERQRQAMLRRANQAASAATSNNHQGEIIINSTERAPSSVSTTQQTSIPEWATTLRKKLKSVLLLLARVLASAALSPFEGPHMLQAETNQQQQQLRNEPSIHQAGRWLAKLQLAHFCWTGLYPSWIHRFSGLSMVPTSPTRLYHQPTTSRLVGLLLASQLVATAVQASASATSRWMLMREQAAQQSTSSSSSERHPQHQPSVIFQSARTIDDGASSAEFNNNTDSKRRSICSICNMERQNPSAPSSCGHVFCWKCLLQWVSGIRPECPLCRAACRPQDIVALYNYSPN